MMAVADAALDMLRGVMTLLDEREERMTRRRRELQQLIMGHQGRGNDEVTERIEENTELWRKVQDVREARGSVSFAIQKLETAGSWPTPR